MGPWWWVWAWLLSLGTMVVVTWAAPRFIAPLFNRFSAITDATLKERVEALLRRCGYEAGGGVFVMDGSRRSAHGNAYFTGIGRNKRIVFFDTLLARIDLAEIEAVLAHELGHFRLHHVRQRLLTSCCRCWRRLALLGWLARHAGVLQRLRGSRKFRDGVAAVRVDHARVRLLSRPRSKRGGRAGMSSRPTSSRPRHADAGRLVTALVKLYRDNATTLTPDRVHSAFYDSHPAAVERITRLQRLATHSA